MTSLPEPGEKLGRYLVEAAIGRGGMGVVYKIRDPRSDMPYAAKVLRPKFARRREFARRFKREARIARRLRHMNVTHVFKLGRWRKTLFYVMEHVQGRSLEAMLASSEKPPLDQAIAIIRKIAVGLNYVHSRRFIHRDIKPGNVLIRHDGHLKITDFGLAQRPGFTKHTRSGNVMGTAKYMAPELICGDRLTPRTDIYALGCLAYELIAGRPPFEADNTEVYMDLHLYTPPKPLELIGADRNLSLFVEKMLSKSVSRRLPSALMVHSWLDFYLTHGHFADMPKHLRNL